MNPKYKYISLTEVIENSIKIKRDYSWFYSLPKTVQENEQITEDAEYELIEPKQLNK